MSAASRGHLLTDVGFGGEPISTVTLLWTCRQTLLVLPPVASRFVVGTDYDAFVYVDMEDHTAVDATLDTFEEYGSHPVPPL